MKKIILSLCFLCFATSAFSEKEIIFEQLTNFEKVNLVVQSKYNLGFRDIQLVEGEYPILLQMKNELGKELGYFALCDKDLKPWIKFPYIHDDQQTTASCIASKGGNYFYVVSVVLDHPPKPSLAVIKKNYIHALFNNKGELLWQKENQMGTVISVSDNGVTVSYGGGVGLFGPPKGLEFIDVQGNRINYYEFSIYREHHHQFSKDGNCFIFSYYKKISDQKKKLVIAYADGKGNILWDLPIKFNYSVDERIYSYSISPDGNYLAVSSTGIKNIDRRAKKWGTTVIDKHKNFVKHFNTEARNYVFSDDNKYLIVEGENKSYLLNCQDGTVQFKASLIHPIFINDVKSKDLMIIGKNTYGVFVIDLNGEVISLLEPRALIFKQKDNLLFAFSKDIADGSWILLGYTGEIK